jgi:hypothetical protein
MWAVVDRIVEPRAVLDLEDGEVIEVGSKYMPHGALAGSVIRISLSLDAGREKLLREKWERLRDKKRDSRCGSGP